MSRSSRLRRLCRSQDSLDQLLADALRAQLNNRRGQGAVKTIQTAQLTLHETFANPDNWLATGIVQIIYMDEATREQTTIGTFQEFTHRRTAARKLNRVAEDVPAQSAIIDHDPFLIHGKLDPCPPSPPQSVYERQAIRDYLRRVEDQRLDELLGVSKHDANALLKQLKDMGAEKLR